MQTVVITPSAICFMVLKQLVEMNYLLARQLLYYWSEHVLCYCRVFHRRHTRRCKRNMRKVSLYAITYWVHIFKESNKKRQQISLLSSSQQFVVFANCAETENTCGSHYEDPMSCSLAFIYQSTYCLIPEDRYRE